MNSKHDLIEAKILISRLHLNDGHRFSLPRTVVAQVCEKIENELGLVEPSFQTRTIKTGSQVFRIV